MSGPYLYDRVKETTSTTGTGAVTLAGAVSGFRAFSVVGDGNTCYYAIVHRTAAEWEVGIGTYTASGTTLTRTRVIASSNSGSAVSFSAGTKDVFISEIASSINVPILERPKPSVDTPDDDFESTTLDGKWAVVDGGSGTVDLFGSSTTGIYDLSTRPGWLLGQAKNSNLVQLRQDYTLPDGNSIIMAFAPALRADGDPFGWSLNEIWIALVVNTDDTTPYQAANTSTYIVADARTDGLSVEMYARSAGTPTLQGRINGVHSAERLYFRIHRSSLTYHCFVSFNGGASWYSLGSQTVASAHTNIWIEIGCYAAPGTPVGIQAIDWIRQGGSGLDPW